MSEFIRFDKIQPGESKLNQGIERVLQGLGLAGNPLRKISSASSVKKVGRKGLKIRTIYGAYGRSGSLRCTASCEKRTGRSQEWRRARQEEGRARRN